MPVMDQLNEAHFFSSSETKALERDLMQLLQMETGWQLAQVAIATSLGTPGDVATPKDRSGSEIRGNTLLRADGSGLSLLAMIAMRAGQALEVAELSRLLEAHWCRGVALLHDRVEDAQRAGRDADSVLLDLLAASALDVGDGITSGGALELLNERIVGQEEAKERIRPLLREALEASPRMLPENLMFTGSRSLGKTLFAQTLADILQLPFLDLNGTTLTTDDDLVDRINTACIDAGQMPQQTDTVGGVPVILYPPVVVFIDECHMMGKRLQESLLTALEPNNRRAKPQGQIANLSQTTFLLATTEPDGLSEAFVSRMRVIALIPYSREDIAAIIAKAYPSLPLSVRRHLAIAGRLVPRQALTEAKDFELHMKQDHPDQRPSEQLALAFMKKRGIDEAGLISRDYEYLEVLERAGGSPVGAQAIATQLHLEEKTVARDIEPFLIQINLVERTPSGRTITRQGLEILSARRAASGA